MPKRKLMRRRTFGLLIFCFVVCQQGSGQQDSSKNFSHRFFPLAFYLPETGLSFGATGVATFRFKNEPKDSRPSQFAYGAAYTLKNQILFYFPFDLFIKNEDYRIRGELGYYRYFYSYYGIGRGSKIDEKERYSVRFPRINTTAFRRIQGDVYVGIGFRYDGFKITEIEENGLLDKLEPIGHRGGTVFNLQLSILLDSRDHLFDPREGTFAEFFFEPSLSSIGSDFRYHKFKLDLRKYYELSNSMILAAQFVLSSVSEEAPFFSYPYLASNTLARGYSDRRFIDRKLVNIQTEFRYKLFERIGVAGFVSYGRLSDSFESIFSVKSIFSAGVGARYYIDPVRLTKARFDLGFSQEGFNFYITVNEAF